MAIGRTPGGVGYVLPDDPTHPTVTPSDTERIARTIESLFRQRDYRDGDMAALLEQIKALAGLSASSPVDGQTAALLSTVGTLTRAAVEKVLTESIKDAPLLGIRADDYGVKGDGNADDTEAFYAAALESVRLGVPLVIPSGLTIGISAYKKLPDYLNLVTNGSVFRQLKPMGRAPVISLGVRSTVTGGLIVRTLGGESCQGVSVTGSTGTSIDAVDVRSEVVGAGSLNIRDNGLRIQNSDNVTIGRIFVENYDWPIWIENARQFTCTWMEAKTYCKAVHLNDVPRMRVSGGRVYGASPNSKYAPGYNGILMDATNGTDDVRITGFTVDDAGEHGYRISGAVTQSNIWLGECISRNVGGSGFKVLGGAEVSTVYNKGITFNACTVIDAGTINQNCCGFLIQRAEDVRIINPTVKRQRQTYSAVEGIRMSSVRHVRITGAKVLDTHKFGLHLDEAFDGNCEDVTVELHHQTASGHSIYLQNPGVTFKDIRIDAFVENTSTDGAAFYAGKYTAPTDSGAWLGMNKLKMTVSESTPAETHISASSTPAALAAFLAEIEGRRGATSGFKNGSLWVDMRTGTRQIMKAGSWVTL